MIFKIIIYRLLFFWVFVGINSISFSQDKSDYQWIFSTNPDPLPGHEGSFLDFNGGQIDTFYRPVGFFIGTNHAQICDKHTGELLAYTNGCHLFDKSHKIMLNGENINPGWVHNDQCGHGYPGSQESLFLRDPANENGYYLLHKRDSLITAPIVDVVQPDLLYSYIDISENNGKGKVLEKNISLFNDYNMVLGYLTACKHANGKDWWLILLIDEENTFYKVLLSNDGPEVIDSQDLGDNFSNRSNTTGQAVFSPDGSKFVLFNPVDHALIFDFDRATGELSNLRQVIVENNPTFSGVAVSSNSRYAYLSTQFKLYQIDLWEDTIQNSLTLIDTFDGFGDPFPNNFYLCQLGPDCRIYITSTNGSQYLHVINSPNEKGKACEFWQHGLKLPFQRAAGIPNFPHFRIDEEDVCDPTITSVFGNQIFYNKKLKIFPNPATQVVNIELPKSLSGTIIISDINSNQILEKGIINPVDIIRLELSHLSPGTYFIEFYPQNYVKEQTIYLNKLIIK